MNYFERLVRRAQLQTPVRSTGRLEDPFEREAALELDVPTAPSPIPSLPAMAKVTIPSKDAQAGEPASSSLPPLAAPLPVPSPQALPRSESPQKPTEKKTPSYAESLQPSAVERPHEVDLLDEADAFMRALKTSLIQAPRPESSRSSLPSPKEEPEGKPLSSPLPLPLKLRAVTPSTPAMETPLMQPRLATPLSEPHETSLQPPPAQRLRPRNDFKSELTPQPQAAPSPRREEAAESQAEPQRAIPTQAPSPIVVVQAPSAPAAGSRMGAGSPRFGLGQL